jgi:hypothetical protein
MSGKLFFTLSLSTILITVFQVRSGGMARAATTRVGDTSLLNFNTEIGRTTLLTIYIEQTKHISVVRLYISAYVVRLTTPAYV